MLTQPVFLYDLADPFCYLVAERVNTALPLVPEWEPVRTSDLAADAPAVDRAEVERLASEAGMQPVRWPTPWPPDSEQAMVAATYAKRVGRAVAFSLAAFRQVFAAGRDLGDGDTVLIAAAACEMHPAAVLKGISLRSVRDGLETAARRARAAGVDSLPAIVVGDQVLTGAGCPEAAASLIAARAS